MGREPELGRIISGTPSASAIPTTATTVCWLKV
jgi:hypothetical protein